MTSALAKPVADQLRAGYAASRRFYRVGAGAMTALTVAMTAICLATSSWASLALVGGLFVPLWLFVLYRTWRQPGPELLARAIDTPERIATILKLVTPRTHLLGVELDSGEMLALRFGSERELDDARRALAERAENATLVPPLDKS
jgi:hypothetical protein